MASPGGFTSGAHRETRTLHPSGGPQKRGGAVLRLRLREGVK
jgi:hypothetical protein